MNSTKKQHYNRKNQAFAGYFWVKTGKVQFLQIPAFSLILYCFPSDFILQNSDFNTPQQLAIF
jgi:hypothetical protein